MAPPRKKPLPAGSSPLKGHRKSSLSATGGGISKHSAGGRSASKSSSAAAAAAATALAAGRSKPKHKAARHVVDQANIPSFERSDNGMRFSSFPIVLNINQKNYYTDYLKKEDQVLASFAELML
jgi:guanyl-specific ribonuclease Sa